MNKIIRNSALLIFSVFILLGCKNNGQVQPTSLQSDETDLTSEIKTEIAADQALPDMPTSDIPSPDIQTPDANDTVAPDSAFPEETATSLAPLEETALEETVLEETVSEETIFKLADKHYAVDIKNGDDSNLGSIDAPFKTIKKARDTIRANKETGVTVYIRQGAYNLSETLEFNKEDSGAENAPNIYMAYPNEEVVMRGSKTITNFTPYSGNIMQSDLSSQGLTNVNFTQLFLNGKRLILSRYPNFNPKDIVNSGFLHVASENPENLEYSFVCDLDEVDPSKWANAKEAQVFIFPDNNFDAYTLNIASIDYAQQLITLEKTTKKPPNYFLKESNRYYIQNIFEELDAPNEWFLDKKNSMLYLYFSDANTQKVITAPVIDNIISLNGSKFITFKGISFEECENNGVVISKSENIEISNSQIKNCKGDGINIFDGKNITIDNCEITEVGGAGIFGANSEKYFKSLTSSNYIVSNNVVHKTGVFEKGAGGKSGIALWQTVGGKISYNHIYNEPRWGIFFGGNNNIVEYNYIHNIGQETSDTAAIHEYEANWIHRGNIIRNNIIMNTGGVCTKPDPDWYCGKTFGIYLDGLSSGSHVYGNTIIKGTSGGMQIGGRDNIIENNTIINSLKDEQLLFFTLDKTDENFKNTLSTLWKEYQKLTGGVKYTANGKWDGAFEYNGSTAYIEMEDSNSLDMVDQLTISAWFKLVSHLKPDGVHTIVGKYYSEYELDIELDSNNKSCVHTFTNWNYDAGAKICIDKDWEVNKWYHVAWTLDKNDVETIYLNGIKLGQHTKTNKGLKQNGTSNLNIGRRSHEGAYFNGVIDEVMVFSRALSSTVVKTIYDAVTSKSSQPLLDLKGKYLVGWWSFNDGIAKDLSGNNNHGDTGYNSDKYFEKYPELSTITADPAQYKITSYNVIKNNIIVYPSYDTSLYYSTYLDYETTVIDENIIWSGGKEISVKLHDGPWTKLISWNEFGNGFDKNSHNIGDIYKVEQYTTEPATETNSVFNGQFNADIKGWYNSSADVEMSWRSSCDGLGLDGGCMKVMTTNKETKANAFAIATYPKPFKIVKGRTYLLKFSAVSEKPDAMVAIVRIKISNPWTELGLHELVSMDKTKKGYSLLFTATESADDAVVDFNKVSSTDVLYYLDNVSLMQVDVTFKNDPSDDYVVFTNTKKAEQEFNLNGKTYCDFGLNDISNSITLKPFESKILLSCYCNNDNTCNNKENNTTCPSDCKN